MIGKYLKNGKIKWAGRAADALSSLLTPRRRRRKTQTELAGTFMCESEVFNGPICQRQCARCKPSKPKCRLCRRPIKRGMINSCIENHCPRYRSET